MVSSTRKGREALARLDAHVAEALQAELAAGDASSLRAAIADFRLAAGQFREAEPGHEGRRPRRTKRSARPRQTGRTLMDPIEDDDQSAVPEVDDVVVPWDDAS